MDQKRQWTLKPRKVQVPRFRAWAAQNLQADDAVVLETTANVLFENSMVSYFITFPEEPPNGGVSSPAMKSQNSANKDIWPRPHAGESVATAGSA